MTVRPRRNPSVVRRSTSTTLPLKSALPDSAASTAAIGSACRRLAFRPRRGPRRSPSTSCARCAHPDFGAGARRLAGGGDGAELGADLPADALHPLPAGYPRHDDLGTARIHRGQRRRRQVADREAGHLRLRIGPAHRVRIDRRDPELGGRQQGLDAVHPTDLDSHHRLEAATPMGFHHLHRTGDQATVHEPLLDHQRRALDRDHGDGVVVVQLLRVDQLDPRAVVVEPSQVQRRMIGTAAAAGPQDPGAGGQRFDILRRTASGDLQADPCVQDPPASRTRHPRGSRAMTPGRRARWNESEAQRSAPRRDAASDAVLLLDAMFDAG